MAAVTLSDVAREAGVSPATASRVLNGSARTPAAEIAERVKAAAAALGYIPNAQAQALARSSSGLLGLVVHDIADPYFSSIARGVQAAARDRGRTLLLISTEGTPAEERDALETFASRRTDGIVMAGSRSVRAGDAPDNEGLLREAVRYESNGGSLVVVGAPLSEPAGAPVWGGSGPTLVPIPNEPLGAELAAALVDAGWGRFAVVAGPEGLLTSDLRLAGFQRGLRERGVAGAAVIRASFNRQGGCDAGPELEALAHSAGAPLCVFAVNDRMAMGVVAALRARGLSAPGDYGIAGFDDIDTLEDFTPELTTVHLPLEEIGRAAAEAALSRAAGGAGAGAAPRPTTAGRVVLRESTALPAR